MFFSFTALLAVSSSPTEWYVSWTGNDDIDCGRLPTTPCLTLLYVSKYVTSGHVINIDGGRPDIVYKGCSTSDDDDLRGLLRVPVSICGYGGYPVIGCHSGSESDYGHLFFHGSKVLLDVVLSEVILENMIIDFKDVNLVMRNVTFRDVSVRTSSTCSIVHVTYESSTFMKTRGCRDAHMCDRVGDHMIFCEEANAYLYNSSFLDTKVNVQATNSAEVVSKDCVFSKKLNEESGCGGLNTTLPMKNGSLYVSGCHFSGQVHNDPILSAINIEAASLRVESIGNALYNETFVYVNIEDCVFIGNERAVSISRPFTSVQIKRCYFRENSAMHAAAAIRLAMAYEATAVIRDCIFIGNSAGATSHRRDPGRFELDQEQVRVNSKQYKGVISLVGKGGAVRIQKGDVIFVNCTFLNNTARLLGGAIFVDRRSSVTLLSCHFENTDSGVHSTQGDVLYSNGDAKVRNCSFIIKTAQNHVTILRHSGDHWSMNVEALWFQCPIGHRLLMINTTSHRIVHDVGLKRSHKLDQLSYYCQTCGENQYSMDYGSVNYTLMNNSTEYFTLLINGNEPFKSHSVNFEYGNISCHECPYGAACDHGIRAVPNFWGYVDGEYAHFQHCPPDYCCSDTKCAINACAEHRRGRLCGQCDPGYSEAMFSSKCVPDESCHQHWIWPLTLGMGILYGLFLVFQNDIRCFLFSWPTKYTRKYFCSCSTRLCSLHLQRKEVEEGLVMNLHQEAPNGTYPNIDTQAEENVSKETTSMTNTSKISPAPVEKDDKGKEKEKEKGGGGGFLIILFYYFQDALLLHVDTVYTRTASKVQKQLKSLLLGLFRFRLDFYQFLDDVCPFSGLRPVTKEFVKTLFVPYMLCLFGCFYLLYKWMRVMNAQRPLSPVTRENADSKGQDKSFSIKLSAGFILAFLFTYQKLATSVFTLLNCVPVGNDSVLFIDGTYTCFQLWQYGVMAYAFSCVLPFSIILMVGPPLLKHKYISLANFFFGCMLPLPALLIWACTCRRAKRKRKPGPLSIETQVVYEILQGPFKDSESKHLLGQLCWSGVLIGRRVILFLCFTFINSVLIRLLCMLAVCFIILLHHIYVQPYKAPKGNLAGALSAAALLIVGGINLLRAGFESAEYVPQGPNRFLMEIFEEIENALLLWLPLAGMSLIALVMVLKLVCLAFDKCLNLCKSEVHSATDDVPGTI